MEQWPGGRTERPNVWIGRKKGRRKGRKKETK